MGVVFLSMGLLIGAILLLTVKDVRRLFPGVRRLFSRDNGQPTAEQEMAKGSKQE